MTRKTDTGNPELGFTIIELMVVVAIAAILIAIAAPSFSEFLSRRRVEGVMSELVTDMHYTRYEAVSRNARVRMTFGPRCYVIHLASATTAECDGSTATPSKTITPASAEIKTVQFDFGRPVAIDAASLTASSAGAKAYLEFEPVRGAAENGAASNAGLVDVRSTTGKPWRLRAVLTAMGRVATCSPSGEGYFTGYSSNCS
jgi:prepilin-type N-terminal cleavage/methylation domain-containing protein